MKKLDHPNILRLFEIFYDDKRYYLVTELCTGGDLFDEINKRKRFEEKDAAIIIKQVLEAAAYCHANLIMHRDIKPENIQIDGKTDNIKLVEFNASKKFEAGKKLSEAYGTLYYMAPEVLMVDYDEKCDIWSIGVVLFILLSGYPPFDGDEDKEIQKKIIIGDYKLHGPIWESISEEAKDLIRKMLTYDPVERISAVLALEHPWFDKYIEKIDATVAVTKALENLKTFKAEQKLQQAAITFIVSQLATSDEINELQIAFKALDKNMDAKLSLDEIKEGYKKYIPEITDEEIDRILEIADADGSGEIDYSEWVVATIDKTKLLSDTKMRQAFSLFDKDGGGSISPQEVKEVLGIGDKNIDEKVWNAIVLEIDEDGSGEISYEEFKTMMERLIN